MNYEEMFNYVYQKLEENNGLKSNKANQSFRNRFDHTKRVYDWCLKIQNDFPKANIDVVLTSAIFHDCGRGQTGLDHAKKGALIFNEYGKHHMFDEDFINQVTDIISKHSDKQYLYDKNESDELKMLLEADLLDEEGALGVVWDLLSEGALAPLDYKCALDAINKHSVHILNQNYMITPIAKMYWDKKKDFVRNFVEVIKQDLFIEGENNND